MRTIGLPMTPTRGSAPTVLFMIYLSMDHWCCASLECGGVYVCVCVRERESYALNNSVSINSNTRYADPLKLNLAIWAYNVCVWGGGISIYTVHWSM